MSTWLRWGLLSVIAVASLAAAEDTGDRQFLAGLRQRGLYRLAESYCIERLERPTLPQSQRAELVIELSRCLAERAASLPAEERAPLWQRALQVTDDFAQQYPQDPRLLLVRFQGALGLLARGELARQEARVAAQPERLFEEARTRLRAAVGQLRKLAEDVEYRLRLQSLPRLRDPLALSAGELASLLKNVQYQLARTYRNQGQCYESGSPDRANSLTEAVKLLDPLSRLDAADPVVWKSRLDLIASYRLLADAANARRQIDELMALQPPPPVELRARAEKIRLALAGDRLSDAVAVLSDGRIIDTVASPELDYAWLETYLAVWRTASDARDTTKAAEARTSATQLVRWIENHHGPYWARRAEMLLAAYVRAAPGDGDLEMLVRAAESSFRSNRLDEALTAYDRARALATKQGNADRAFQLGYTAAAVEHRRNRHQQARDRFLQLARGTPDHPQAADAHLLAIFHAAQIVKDQPQEAWQPYAELLIEHLDKWPDGPTADKARMRWGRLLEHQRDWHAAVARYAAVSQDSAEYLAAVTAVERCCLAWLGELQAAGRPTRPTAAEAADLFESLIFQPNGAGPEHWGPVQRRAALAAARLRLQYTPDGHARAERALTAALQGATDAPPEWTSNARALLVLALAGQGRSSEASRVLTQLSVDVPGDLLNMLQGLGRLATSAQPELRKRLAELQLDGVKLLHGVRTQLSEDGQQSLGRIYAQALADAGQTEKALAEYRSLAAAHPRDGAVQEAYAMLLLRATDRASKKLALAKWRELEKKSPPASRRWFLAKYWVARLHCDLGNKQQAARLIELARLLHPELGGPQMKARFDELLARCRG